MKRRTLLRPTRAALWLIAAGVAPALLPLFLGARLWPISVGALTFSGLLVLFDALLIARRRDLSVEIDVPPTFRFGETASVGIRLAPAAAANVPAEVELALDLDPAFVPQEAQRCRVRAGVRETKFRLVATRRGSFAVRELWLRWTGPLGLIDRTARLPIDASVSVTLPLGQVRAEALRFFSNREFLVGLKVESYEGEGSEFESLREFVAGFDHRSIDWRSSARHAKLLSRHYRAERNHQVVLAFDSGYLMREPIAERPRLDHAIQAGLLLGYIALKTGDRVGFFQFDARPRGYLDPHGGIDTMRRLQQRCAAIEYSPHETNFTLAIADLSLRLRRRSLVIVLTDFVDTIAAQLMVDNLQRLAQRHLVLFVTLSDPELAARRARTPDSGQELNELVVVDALLRERELLYRRLGRLGVQCVEAAPGALSERLVNRYLHIRRKELV